MAKEKKNLEELEEEEQETEQVENNQPQNDFKSVVTKECDL